MVLASAFSLSIICSVGTCSTSYRSLRAQWIAPLQELKADEGNPWAGSKLDVRDLPVVDAPVHIAGDDMAIAEDTLHNRYVSKPVGSLHVRLQIYNSSCCGV